VKLESLKQVLLSIEQEIVRMNPDTPVHFHQQEKTPTNMALRGLKGETLWVTPRSNGFSIGLSGKSLERRMSSYMSGLVGRKQDGFSQLNKNKGKKALPFWIVSDVKMLRAAVFEYVGVPTTQLLFDFPDEEKLEGFFYEGAVKTITVNAYERNAKARKACIEHHGMICKVCSFDFYSAYGEIGAGYIQVHHLVPISQIGVEYQVDPINDLVPVCANCHAMIHRTKKAMDISELAKIVDQRS
jgi:hypothetical protein